MVKHKCITHKANIDASYLEKSLVQLSGTKEIVILICKDEEINDTLAKLRRLSVDNMMLCHASNRDIVFSTNIATAHEVAVILESVDAEVVVMYFADEIKTIIHKLGKNDRAIITRNNVIENGDCFLVMTWVTNENQVYIDYDSLRVDKKEVLRLLDM